MNWSGPYWGVDIEAAYDGSFCSFELIGRAG